MAKETSFGTYAGATIPVLTSLIGIVGTSEDIDAKNEALMTNMGNEAESLLYSQGVMNQQLNDIDRAMGDVLSASGLEALKNESSLKAAGAETGGSNDEAIATAQVNKLHRDEAIVRTADTQKASKQSELVASRLGFENTLESMMSSFQSDLSAGLEIGSAGLKGMLMGLPMMTDASKKTFFGTNTTGEA